MTKFWENSRKLYFGPILCKQEFFGKIHFSHVFRLLDFWVCKKITGQSDRHMDKHEFIGPPFRTSKKVQLLKTETFFCFLKVLSRLAINFQTLLYLWQLFKIIYNKNTRTHAQTPKGNIVPYSSNYRTNLILLAYSWEKSIRKTVTNR